MALFTAQLDPQLSQGDLFRSDWDNDRATPLGSVAVISENCDIEHSPETILVADTLADGDTEAGLRASIRGGKVWWGFHLADFGRWVNLRTIRPVQKNLFNDRLDRRLASMSAEGQIALAGKVFSFLTHATPPRQRYFKDGHGVVWDSWEVRRKDVGAFEAQSPLRVAPDLANGWISMTSAGGARRVAPAPFGWQYLPEAVLAAMLQQAPVADPQDLAAQAIDQAVRAKA